MLNKKFKCRCHTEPRGDHGLEGYLRNEYYLYEVFHALYKLYPTANSNYYEICSKRVFFQYFEHNG